MLYLVLLLEPLSTVEWQDIPQTSAVCSDHGHDREGQLATSPPPACEDANGYKGCEKVVNLRGVRQRARTACDRLDPSLKTRAAPELSWLRPVY